MKEMGIIICRIAFSTWDPLIQHKVSKMPTRTHTYKCIHFNTSTLIDSQIECVAVAVAVTVTDGGGRGGVGGGSCWKF